VAQGQDGAFFILLHASTRFEPYVRIPGLRKTVLKMPLPIQLHPDIPCVLGPVISTASVTIFNAECGL
jgi:hypothetical protein